MAKTRSKKAPSPSPGKGEETRPPGSCGNLSSDLDLSDSDCSDTPSLTPESVTPGTAPATNDDEGFTLVERKKKPANKTTLLQGSIPVILKGKTPLCKQNPNLVSREISSYIGKPLEARYLRSGDLMVKVATMELASRLTTVTAIGNVPVTVSLPRSITDPQGLIKGVDISLDNDVIRDALTDYQVTHVRRMIRFSASEVGCQPRQFSTDRVVLTFSGPLPTHVTIGFQRFEVTSYLRPPAQCFKCQRFGHMAKDCKGADRCRRCGGGHLYKDCPTKDVPHCCNCGGPHPATWSQCPAKLQATKTRSVMVTEGKTWAEAVKGVKQAPKLNSPPKQGPSNKPTEHAAQQSAQAEAPKPKETAIPTKAKENKKSIKTLAAKPAHHNKKAIKPKANKGKQGTSSSLPSILKVLLQGLFDLISTLIKPDSLPPYARTILSTVQSLLKSQTVHYGQ